MGSKDDQSPIKWTSDFIWSIADNLLRNVYVRGKYRDVILPFNELRFCQLALSYGAGGNNSDSTTSRTWSGIWSNEGWPECAIV